MSSLLFVGMLTLGVGTAGHHWMPSLSEPALLFVQSAAPVVEEFASSVSVQAVADAAENVAEEVEELATAVVSSTPEQSTRMVELGRGRTFSRMLADADVDSKAAFAASAALSKIFDARRLRAGEEFTLSIVRTGEEEVLTSVTFAPEPTKEVSIVRNESGDYVAQIKNTPLERQRVAARGEIHNSLYAAGSREGVPRSIMASLIRAFSHEIDFQRDIHPGDRFELLYDQPTAKDGTPVGQGVIIYAALNISGKIKPLYRVTFGDGAVDYFNERGQSIRRSLLRTPVEGARMSSGFGMRRHPILGFSKMHKGTDFAAPPGTPIYAAGSGVVEMARFNGGYGRFILLRHNGEVETAYAHMSRFAKGIRSGVRVNQGDVIGYVGTSGRSTGPHLHFEVRVNRVQVNPMGVSMPVGRVLKGKTLHQFKNGQEKIKGEYTALLKKGAERRKANQMHQSTGAKVSKAIDPKASAAIKVAAR